MVQENLKRGAEEMSKERKSWETLVVVLLLAVTCFVIGTKIYLQSEAAKNVALVEEVRAVRNAVNLYVTLNNTFPPDLNTLTTEKYRIANKEDYYLTGINTDTENFPVSSVGTRFAYYPATGWVDIGTSEYQGW